jgi:Uma2 family endonuclease
MNDLILNKILKSPRLPYYFNRINKFYENEKKKRHDFYNKITPSEKAEFINGEIIMHSPATNKHLQISINLATIFKVYTQKYDLGQVYVEKALIALKRNDYEPDLCFFKKEKADKFSENMLLFPAPDLVVEILSKSTAKNDRGIKFVDYALNGIQEYWIIDPENETVEQYFLADEKYQIIKKSNEGTLKCKEIEKLELPIRAIFDTNLNQDFLKKLMDK